MFVRAFSNCRFGTIASFRMKPFHILYLMSLFPLDDHAKPFPCWIGSTPTRSIQRLTACAPLDTISNELINAKKTQIMRQLRLATFPGESTAPFEEPICL